MATLVRHLPDSLFYLSVDSDAAEQIGKLQRFAKLTRAYNDAATVDTNGDVFQDVLQGVALGDLSLRRAFRLYYNNISNRVELQRNVGTDATPSWSVLLIVESDADTTISGDLTADRIYALDGLTLGGNLDANGFYLVNARIPASNIDDLGIVFKESEAGGREERDDTIVFDSSYFYLTQAGNDGNPLISFLDSAIQISVRESESGGYRERDDTIVFDSSFFYVTSDNRSKPLVSIHTAPTAAITVTTLTTGSGTYAPPSGCRYIWVRLVGGGGGGAGTGTGAGGGNGNTGGNTTFGTLTGGGGAGGAGTGAASGGAGGAGSGGDLNLVGGTGGGQNGVGTGVGKSTGHGGCSVFGGAGGLTASDGNAGLAAQANTGSGGSGGSITSTTGGGPGGGAGGYVEKIFSPVAGSYSYSVGAGGTGGTAGTSGTTGAAGGSGVIIIHEHY